MGNGDPPKGDYGKGDDALERVRAMMQWTPQGRALGLEVLRVEGAKVWGRAPYKAELIGDPETGVIAGGVITTFLDHLSGMAAVLAMREATTVATHASDAFKLKRGVCQDFSHVMIAGLRGLGIPAGYVSGFLRTIPPPGKERLEGADAMHAWVRAWCGREVGWIEFDPTNDMLASNDHITVGYGRDYSDVAPIVGVLRTTGSQTGEQAVDVIPVG